jgi:hypothetical protein
VVAGDEGPTGNLACQHGMKSAPLVGMYFVKPLSILGVTGALLLSSGGLLQPTMAREDSAPALRFGGGYVPVEISIQQGLVGPGQMVTYRVVLEGVADRDQKVSISCSNSSVYSQLPVATVVAAGSNSSTFTAVFADQLPSSWMLSATCNGGTITMAQIVPPRGGR